MVLLVFALWFIILYALQKQTKPKGKCKNLTFLFQFRLIGAKVALENIAGGKRKPFSFIYLPLVISCLGLGCDVCEAENAVCKAS